MHTKNIKVLIYQEVAGDNIASEEGNVREGKDLEFTWMKRQ